MARAASSTKRSPRSAKKDAPSRYQQRLERLTREAVLFFAAACTLFLLAALISYSPSDPGWAGPHTGDHISNIFGLPGAWVADILLALFGYLAFVFPWLFLYSGWLFYRGSGTFKPHAWTFGIRTVSLLLCLIAACCLTALAFGISSYSDMPQGAGGVIGTVFCSGLVAVLNTAGTVWLLVTIFVITLSTGLGFSWIVVTEKLGGWVLVGSAWLSGVIREQAAALRERRSRKRRIATPTPQAPPPKKSKPKRTPVLKPAAKKSTATQLSLPMDNDKPAIDVPKYDPDRDEPLPLLTLLDPARESVRGADEATLNRMSEQLERHLADFKVDAKVVAVEPGPVITRFEVEPAPGVKVSQFTNLSRDLARAMSTTSVRVVEVIPGKSVVGLEIPNAMREVVMLREILQAPTYQNAKSNLTMALGKDISGNPVTANLGKMPHLLVAGTTGSGKSVAVNVMILSMLYKATAQDVRFIMIDPKMLELSIYEDIPHLLAPVVTDMKDAANALRWCVGEMERRYKLMAALGVRNMAGFNRKVRQAADKGQPIPNPLAEQGRPDDDDSEVPALESLPSIVIIVDELSDLMMVVGKKVEQLIARLAQKARAAGLHMILATQRPSVDVITGLIKANIPTRIAFQVASRVDSRTILDQQGAESLLGNGDMLFLPPGTGFPARVHGAFVDDHEVHKVVEYLKQIGQPDYLEEILEGAVEAPSGDSGDTENDDPLYDQAVAVVLESRKASISYVQRRLRVGYNRAARLVEQMEEVGLIGPAGSGGRREVLAPPPPD